MSSEEKAKELVEKYFKMGDVYPITTHGHAKRCALITVDEILIIMKEEYLGGSEKIEYWNRVKSAIEKL